MERLASAGSSYLVTDQAGFNRASVAFVDVRQLGQRQVLLNIGCANVAPLALGKIRQSESCRGSSRVRIRHNGFLMGLYVLRIAE